ncbi:MAG: TetR family transcriptional regulator [Oscillospiraceae bacterium]|nr:TetR family transcriptional regulator [Oscillospiraceae bacterium]
MKRDAEKTRLALIDAAEKLMSECDDPAEVTARAITNEAGVNLAMINYIFGSREELLFEVFAKLRAEAGKYDDFEAINNADISAKEKLILVHFKSMKIMLENYKFCKAITKYVLTNRSISADRGSLAFIKEHFGSRKTEGECRLIAFEISSLHELAVLRYEEIKEVCGIDLTNDDDLREYVTENINRFLEV